MTNPNKTFPALLFFCHEAAMTFVPVFLFFTVIAEIRQGFCLENYPLCRG
jgi:hypothetical protein